MMPIGKNNKFFKMGFLGAVTLTVFFLPINMKGTNVGLICMIAMWIFIADFSKYNRSFKHYFFLSLFLFLLLGLIYTYNIDRGILIIIRSLPLLFLPIIFSTCPPLTKKEINLIISIYTLCVVGTNVLFILYHANMILSKGQPISYLFTYYHAGKNYTNLLGLHTAYFSVHILLAMIFLFKELIYHSHKLKKNIILILLILFLEFSLFLATSKTQILISILIINLCITIPFKSLNSKIFVSVILNIVFILAGFNVTYVKQRFEKSIHNDFNIENNGGYRLPRWEAAINAISESPWIGYGTGDVKQVLNDYYIRMKLFKAANLEYNAHNSYLEISLQLGVIGLLCLLFNLFWPLIYNNNIIYILFILIISLSFLTESMLSRHNGIVTYSFFNAFLFFHYSKQIDR